METISVDYDRKELLPMVGLATIMFGASLWLLYAGLFTDFRLSTLGPATSGFSVLAGGFGTLFFGYGFFYIMYRFLFPKGALLITDKGIYDRTSAVGSKELIPFTTMKKAKLEIVNASPQIGIDLTNEEEYLASLPWLKRKTQAINKKYFNTSMVSLNVPHDSREQLEELIEIINVRMAHAKNKAEA